MKKAPRVTRCTLSKTAQEIARTHGFSQAEVNEAMHAPKNMYPSHTRPGQWRRVTRSVCLVGVMDGETFRVITMFPNGSAAPKSP